MLFDQISNDIKEAMKARDKVRLETLRNIKKVFIEAKTAPGANDTLEDADAMKILAKLLFCVLRNGAGPAFWPSVRSRP